MQSLIIEHLESIQRLIGESQNKYYEFLLKRGKVFTERTDYKSELLPLIKQKQCFNNSFLIAIRGDIEYWEGYYLCGDFPIPLEHAFNKKIKSKNIIDTTAQKFEIPVKEWFGVKVPNWVLSEWYNSEQYLTPLQFYYEITTYGNAKTNLRRAI